MIKKQILNGLTLSLMLSMISTPAHAGWFSWVGDFFNKPTQNALIATTAFAGASLLATFATAWSWWKANKAWTKEKESLQLKADIAKNAAIMELHGERLAAKQRIDRLNSDLKTTQAVLAGKIELIKVRESQLAQTNEQAIASRAAWSKQNIENRELLRTQANKIRELENQDTDSLVRDLRAQKNALEMQNETLKNQLNRLQLFARPHQHMA